MKRPLHRFSQAAFTLIELLIVLMIIAILVSIAFPVYSKVTAKARQVGALAHLKQIGTGFAGYIPEHKSTFPPSLHENLVNPLDPADIQTFTFAQYIEPYIYSDSPGLFSSVSDRPTRREKNIFISPTSKVSPTLVQWGFPMTFSANPALCLDTTGGLAAKSILAAKRPADTILVTTGCQGGSDLESHHSFDAVTEALAGNNGGFDSPINVGADADSAAGLGHIRYGDNIAPCLMVDGSARVFKKGAILKRHVWPGESP